MLTRFVVDVYAWLTEIYLWLVVLLSSIAGYHYAAPIFNPLLNGAGLMLESHVGGKVIGGLIFAIAAFLVSAVVLGPILVLFDIRKSIRTLEARESGFAAWDQRAERKEPSL
jgi:hypothetical protein